MGATDTSGQIPSWSSEPEPETPAAPAQATKPTLKVSQTGDLATVTGSGLPPDARCQVSFASPSGSISSAVAIADEEGSLTSYGRLPESGKYKISVAGESGAVLASTPFTAQAS